MRNDIKNDVTQYLMMVCYHCKDAKHCTTEEQCRACMTDIVEEIHKTEQQRELTTEELLVQYAQ